MVVCCVVNCGNTNVRDTMSFYRIPAIITLGTDYGYELSKRRRAAWLLAINRADFTEQKAKNGRVCSRHFISGKPCKLEDVTNPDWVPCQHMGYTTGTCGESRPDTVGHNRGRKILAIDSIPNSSSLLATSEIKTENSGLFQREMECNNDLFTVKSELPEEDCSTSENNTPEGIASIIDVKIETDIGGIYIRPEFAANEPVFDVKHGTATYSVDGVDVKSEVVINEHEVVDGRLQTATYSPGVFDVKSEVQEVLDIKLETATYSINDLDVKSEIATNEHEVVGVRLQTATYSPGGLDVKSEAAINEHEVVSVRLETPTYSVDGLDVMGEVAIGEQEVVDVKLEPDVLSVDGLDFEPRVTRSYLYVHDAVWKVSNGDSINVQETKELQREYYPNACAYNSAPLESYKSTVELENNSVCQSVVSLNPLSSIGDTSVNTPMQQYDVTSEKQLFHCDLCSKGITTMSNLKTHMRIHTGERPYSCPVCDRTFIQRSHLTTHLHSHKDMDKLNCSHCGENFTDLKKLWTHVKKHKCHNCAKTFGSTSSLAKHLQKCLREGRHLGCDQCSRRFTSMSKLLRHTRWHSGEKPYVCDTCGRSFSENSTLKSHVLTHAEKRPYKCEFCGKSFTQSTNLTRHKRVHTGDKPFHCNICDKRFTQKSNLTVHKQSVHISHSLFT